VKRPSQSGETPFLVASHCRHIEIVKYLLASGREMDINKAAKIGKTPFYLACFYGRIDIVKLLLNDKRVDINKAADRYGYTPFFSACVNGQLDIIESIIASGREVSVNIKDENKKTAINIIRGKGNVEKAFLESEEGFQKRKRDCSKIVELLESFERNPNETRFKLGLKLGLAGKIQFSFFLSFFFLFLFSFFFLMFILSR